MYAIINVKYAFDIAIKKIRRMFMENNEFEKIEAKKKKNFCILKNFAKRALAKIGTVLVVVGLIFTIVGCNKDKEKDPDDTTNPGITIPVDPDDPVIDPDDPVIDPDDPVIDPDPENPGEDIPPEDVPPEDIPPEDIPPEDKPPEEENPGQEDPSTEIPGSIDEVDEVDEINYFADEFIERVNQNYGDALAKRMIGASATRENLANADWSISQGSERGISQIEVRTIYEYGSETVLRVGTITFDQEYSIQDILNGNAGSPIAARAYNASVGTTNKDANLDLGKTVIQTIDADNTLEGDIWCSISSVWYENQKDYRTITVYQITENGVEKYSMFAEASSADPASIMSNIQNGLYNKSSISQSTEYTFAGEKIEQANESSQNLANCNYYFDDIVLC